MNAAEEILETLGIHLKGPAHIRLLGGAALILGYGMNRTTEDADLLADDAEVQLLIDQADFGLALEQTNLSLSAKGYYISHIWGPEQQILTPNWRQNCRDIDRKWSSSFLNVSVLGPIDLILSKLCRADDGDIADILYLVKRECIPFQELELAFGMAIIPSVFSEIAKENAKKVFALLS